MRSTSAHRASVFPPPTPPTDTSTLSLHDALPIYDLSPHERGADPALSDGARRIARDALFHQQLRGFDRRADRKSSLNSSHLGISYAVFCLKKKIKLIM